MYMNKYIEPVHLNDNLSLIKYSTEFHKEILLNKLAK